MSIAIIDYDAGNTGSLKFALSECGFENYVAYTPADLHQASRIILPGVGAFNKAMQVLRERGFDHAIKHAVIERKLPLLGICLGMQVLATKGIEGGDTDGLDLISGDVCLLKSEHEEIRLPHVGWNEARLHLDTPIFNNIPSGSDFYFVHSYHFKTASASSTIAETIYGRSFASVVMQNNIIGVQFHPEKSGRLGRQLLKNFAQW